MGKEEGLEEGIELGIQKVAKNMLEKGKPISEIADMTGLSEEEIRGLKRRIKDSLLYECRLITESTFLLFKGN